MNDQQASALGVVGVGVSACALCCAGPILAAVGGISTLGPVAAGGALLVAGVGVLRHRRRPVDPTGDSTERVELQ